MYGIDPSPPTTLFTANTRLNPIRQGGADEYHISVFNMEKTPSHTPNIELSPTPRGGTKILLCCYKSLAAAKTINTSLAAPGALAHRLQRCIDCNTA